jgi:hypothetical protein
MIIGPLVVVDMLTLGRLRVVDGRYVIKKKELFPPQGF